MHGIKKEGEVHIFSTARYTPDPDLKTIKRIKIVIKIKVEWNKTGRENICKTHNISVSTKIPLICY